MPIIKSAVKRMRQTAKRRARNVSSKRSMRGEMKLLMEQIESKDAKKAAETLKRVQSELDKAVKKNILKKNTAARKKAQLSAKVKAIGGKSTPTAKKAPTKPAAKANTAKSGPKKATPAKAPVKKAAVKKAPAKKTITKK